MARGPIVAIDSITLVEGVGVEGDRNAGTPRQVTLVSTGELAAAAEAAGLDTIDGLKTRRNIVVDIAMLPRAHRTRIKIGEAELLVWRDCPPCELMDEVFGEGTRDAMAKRAGLSATVHIGGQIDIGDQVTVLERNPKSG